MNLEFQLIKPKGSYYFEILVINLEKRVKASTNLQLKNKSTKKTDIYTFFVPRYNESQTVVFESFERIFNQSTPQYNLPTKAGWAKKNWKAKKFCWDDVVEQIKN